MTIVREIITRVLEIKCRFSMDFAAGLLVRSLYLKENIPIRFRDRGYSKFVKSMKNAFE